MAWIGCWGSVLSSNMADFFRFLTFPQYFFLRENFKSYSENALFNSLVCKKCFIILLYKHFWLTIWPWKLTMLHFIKFKILPHTLLVIQFHLHLWANFHQLKIYVYIYTVPQVNSKTICFSSLTTVPQTYCFTLHLWYCSYWVVKGVSSKRCLW